MSEDIPTTCPPFVRWVQETGESARHVEVSIPLELPEGLRPRDLQVSVEGNVLAVRGKENLLWEGRLFAACDLKEWQVVNNVLNIDIEKRHASAWPCLIAKAMDPSHPLFFSSKQLDGRIASSLPPLRGRIFDNESDPDGILDDALEEISDAAECDGRYADLLKKEAYNLTTNFSSMKNLLKAAEERIANAEGEEKRLMQKQFSGIERIIASLVKSADILRGQPSVTTLMQAHLQAILRDRLFIGQTSDREQEEPVTDEEKSLPGSKLCAMGIEIIQEGANSALGLHLLRLAACNHGDPQAIAFLLRVYADIEGCYSRGMSLLFHRALEDDMEPLTNEICGKLCERNNSDLISIPEVAIYFFQRSSMMGFTTALMGLASTYMTISRDRTRSEAECLDAAARCRLALFESAQRGCELALYTLAKLYLEGAEGFPRSPEIARTLADAAAGCAATPERQRSAADLRQEAQRLATAAPPTSAPSAAAPPPAASATTAATAGAVARSGGTVAAAPPAEAERPRPAVSRVGMAAPRRPLPPRTAAARHAIERRVVLGTVLAYVAYTVMFPIRLMFLPRFYAVVEPLAERLAGLWTRGA